MADTFKQQQTYSFMATQTLLNIKVPIGEHDSAILLLRHLPGITFI